MARKKKKTKPKNAATRKPQKTVPVSSRTRENLTSLLDQFSPSSAPEPESSSLHDNDKRLWKQISSLHHALEGLGFEEQVIRVILVESNATNLEQALDWACLSLDSQNLPPILTDHVEAVDTTTLLEHRLTVVVPVKASSAATSSVDGVERNMLDMAVTNETPQEESTKHDEDDSDAALRKAWLLSQYEYEDDNEEVDQEEQSAPQIVSEMTREELQLHETEEELRECEATLQDEAQKYMMSKHEIKDLQRKTKQLRKQVEGMRRKVERQKAKSQAEQYAREAQEVETKEDEAFGMNLFGQVDEGDDDGASEDYGGDLFLTSGNANAMGDGDVPQETASTKPPAMAAVKIPNYPIPENWSGKTPKKLLEEWCKKRKIPHPQYKQNPFQIVVRTSPPLTIVEEGPFHSFKEAQHYLATRALYELNPTLQLYRILPPVFSDLWMSWVDAVKKEKDAEKQQLVDALEHKIQEIVDAIRAKQAMNAKTTTSTKTESSRTAQQLDINAPDGPDSWEGVGHSWEDDVSEPDVPATVEPSIEGRKLEGAFCSRRETAQYQAMLRTRTSLPMYSYRQQLLDTIRENQVTVLCAETGAGKTTQCPQFLLEEALEAGCGDNISILCTQPRRVSAMSVAERVSEEIGDSRVGDTVGYHIRLESKRSAKTKLLFCTTGVVLRRLQDDPTLEGVTHVVVDEVHERQWQIDFLLIALRRLIYSTRKDLKVILMSATLDAELFTNFFPGAPLLAVPGRTYPVTNYYLEDLLDATDHFIEEGSRCAVRSRRDGASGSLWVTTKGGEKRRETFSMDDDAHLADVSEDYIGYKMTTRRSMDRVNEQVVNYDLIEDVLSKLLVNPDADGSLKPPDSTVDISSGAVLVFLPGAGEIQTLRGRLEASRIFGDRGRFDIIPMHSTLLPKDQRRAFVKSKRGCQKIILATNIAETSVTIPDVVCVIDSGLVREVHQNKSTSTSTLITTWCSKASIKQRSGRAGRVQAGICCRLFSSRTAEHRMKDQAIPELQRVPLEEVCLSILAGRLGDNCMEFLTQAPQPPSEKSVSLALDLLTQVGAIDSAGQLTPLGHHLSKLPMDVRLGKMLIMACLFRCLDPVLTVAASLSCKSPFPTYARDSLEAHNRHRIFHHAESDFMTICNVWKAYRDACAAGKARKFCDMNYLSHSALSEIRDQREQYMSLLRQIGFVSNHVSVNDDRKKEIVPLLYDENAAKESVVHAVISAGLYPNVARFDTTSAVSSGLPTLTHNKERVFVHKSSVNFSKAPSSLSSDWIMFYEKFATHRVHVSETAPLHPFAMLLYGGPLLVKHQERKVVVGDWIELPIAAQTGVLFRELRKMMDCLLEEMMESPEANNGNDLTRGIVKLIRSSHS